MKLVIPYNLGKFDQLLDELQSHCHLGKSANIEQAEAVRGCMYLLG